MLEESPPRKKTQKETKFLFDKLYKINRKEANLIHFYLKLKYSISQYFHRITRKKLKLKNSLPVSAPVFNSHYNEHGFRYFWRNINDFFFKRIDSEDLDKLEILSQFSSQPLKSMLFLQVCAC